MMLTKKAVKVAPESLAKYSGTYLLGGDIAMQYGAVFIPLTVALEEGALKLASAYPLVSTVPELLYQSSWGTARCGGRKGFAEATG